MFIAANNVRGKRDIRFAVVRYGNVFNSRGSVVPFFLAQREKGVLPITDPRMTRFNILLSEGVDMVLWGLRNTTGGEIFVPKIPSYRILDLAEAVAPGCEHKVVGIRPGEKLHEEMITESDGVNTVDLGRYYAILPPGADLEAYRKQHGGTEVPAGFHYNSGTNPHFLTQGELRDLAASVALGTRR
jgi:FlaA1/EpsC-like NDP-sugar epimerase